MCDAQSVSLQIQLLSANKAEDNDGILKWIKLEVDTLPIPSEHNLFCVFLCNSHGGPAGSWLCFPSHEPWTGHFWSFHCQHTHKPKLSLGMAARSQRNEISMRFPCSFPAKGWPCLLQTMLMIICTQTTTSGLLWVPHWVQGNERGDFCSLMQAENKTSPKPGLAVGKHPRGALWPLWHPPALRSEVVLQGLVPSPKPCPCFPYRKSKCWIFQKKKHASMLGP